MFEVIVEAAVEVPGRGVEILGSLRLGRVPPTGTEVLIGTEGTYIKTALLSGVAFGLKLPRVGLLLRGVQLEDVPIGSQIRNKVTS